METKNIYKNGLAVNKVAKEYIQSLDVVVANINEQLIYADVRADELGAGIILTGGAAKLNGFVELLEKTTKMKVRRGGYPSHVNVLATKAQNSDIYIQSVAVAAIAVVGTVAKVAIDAIKK